MNKRSLKSHALLGIVLGTSAFALAACQEEKSETMVFDAEWDCTQPDDLAFGMTPAQCEDLATKAKAEHMETAPRYDALQVCEDQHGLGNCQEDPAAAAGGGSSFLPMLTGFMIGNMLSNNGQSSYATRPLVPTKSGSFATTDGKTKVSSLNGKTSISNRSLTARPAATLGKAPMSRATVRSSGGFGRVSTGGGFRGG